jgi:uncharacterized membrane protein YedE/YeeE
MKLFCAFFFGLLFGLGLIVSGMTNPAKVLGFLDLAGLWDPSLVLVMAGALMVSLPLFALIGRRKQALLGDPMQLPATRRIDMRLLLGSLTFGVGWGLAGYCPGPALVGLGTGGAKPLLFCIAMLAGMALFELIEHLRKR